MKVSMFHLMPHRELPADFEQRYHSVWVDPPWWELADAERVGQYYNWTLDELTYAAGAGLDALGDRVALKDCLTGLEPGTRRAILLAYIGGFTHGEIAAIQSVPLGTCKSWIRRGLDLLRRCLT